MVLLLIPGFWLDATSWDRVVPLLGGAGHHVRALTLPGLRSRDEPRAHITLGDQVDFVVSQVDAIDPAQRVILCGHSGGGAIAHAVADARPERISMVVYVDCVPLGEGMAIAAGLPAVDGEIPLPPWGFFDPEDLVDLDATLREEFRNRAIAQPAHVAQDAQQLHDRRRYDVPAVVISCEYPTATLKELMSQGHPYTAELAQVANVRYLDLPTGHWPQFTRPAELAATILRAVS